MQAVQAGAGLRDCFLWRVELLQATESFDFYGVAAGVVKEHRPLFTRLPLKADLRLHDKRGAGIAQSLRHRLPIVQM